MFRIITLFDIEIYSTQQSNKIYFQGLNIYFQKSHAGVDITGTKV